MSPPVVIAVPGFEGLAAALCARLGAEPGAAFVRHFPDGEVYVRVDSPVDGREVMLVCGLDRPAERLLPALFLAGTARDLGARRVGLVAPYLAFMRQDARFHPGEGVTSAYFGRLLSSTFDWLVTVDPHLHRHHALDAVYSIPTQVVHAAPAIAAWIAAEVADPVLIGPDAESEQWVADVAGRVGAPFLVLEKTRRGDRDVSVSAPDLQAHLLRTPIVLDDIISTGRTMIETLHHLASLGTRAPICIGIHGVFSDAAHADLLAAGAARIVTCDTIAHPSNAISVTELIAAALAAR